MAFTFVIDGLSVPWAAHGGYGKRSFNPRYREKQYTQWQLKAQFNRDAPISGPVRVDLHFVRPIPKGTSKARKLQMLNGIIFPITRPDRGNYLKFYEDCLTGVAIEDDSQIVAGEVCKIFGESPKTIIKLTELA